MQFSENRPGLFRNSYSARFDAVNVAGDGFARDGYDDIDYDEDGYDGQGF